MAFNPARFSTFNAGQTGAGLFAKYDATGFTGEGGDAWAAITAANFFNHRVVKDALRQAQDPQTGAGITNGKGLPILIHARTGLRMYVLIFNASQEITIVGGGGGPAWSIVP